jgi:hypothetical protein
MNKKLFLFIILLFPSCEKATITKLTPITKGTDLSCALIATKLISVSGNELILNIEFAILDTNLIENSIAQSDITLSDLNFSFYGTPHYDYEVNNLKKYVPEHVGNQSTLVLFDKSYKTKKKIDDCLLYVLKGLNGTDEFAFGGLSENFGDQEYKIYGDGFINNKTSSKSNAVYQLSYGYSEGESYPLKSGYNSIDYLLENAINTDKNLVIICNDTIKETASDKYDLIQKAIDNNIKVSFIAPHDYNYTEIAVKTNGFHIHENERERINYFSINKLISQNYHKLSMELSITPKNGNFQTSNAGFGWIIDIKHNTYQKSHRLYYDIYY